MPAKALAALWDAFWREPSQPLINAMLALPDADWRRGIRMSPWEEPPKGDKHPPNLCASALATLAIADHRAQHRTEEKSVRLQFGLDSLGEPAGKSSDHQTVFGWGIALWDRLLSCCGTPPLAEIERCFDVIFHENVWECPEWHDDHERLIKPDGVRSKATPLMLRLFEAAAAVDPSLGLGSSMVAKFCSTANGRNRHMTKWEMMLSVEISNLWDPMWRPDPDGQPLWATMMKTPIRLCIPATDLLLRRIGEMPGSPLSTDQTLAESILSVLLGMGPNHFLSHNRNSLQGWHARRIAEHWAGVPGARFGHAKKEAPDWMWVASARLRPFDPDPPKNPTKLLQPGGSGSFFEREVAFQAFEILDRLGCDANWVGSDGKSALDKMKKLRGYEAWIARFEARALADSTPGANGSSSEHCRL